MSVGALRAPDDVTREDHLEDDIPIESPPRRVRALLLLNVFAASLYLTWWFTPGRMGTPALFWALAAAEAFSFVHLAGLWWTVWATKIPKPARMRASFTVDVLIPTHGEPADVLRRTISAAVRMRHPHRTIVLDDMDDPAVKELALGLGAEYLARSDNRGAKAGNLNNALGKTSGELVAIFDADHVPRKDFLVRLLGYFDDPDLGFVQTPQYYRNAGTNLVARGAIDQQAIFYGPICRGKNGLDSAFCCGTNVIFRRAALDDVGGFDEHSVVEDLVTSMRIHRSGWRSVYHPYVLAAGLGPPDISSFARQQFRWARGAVGAFMSGEPFRRGFTVSQRVQYLLATTFYLTGFATLIYASLPFIYAFFGMSAFSPRSSTFVLFYAPYLMLAFATIRWGLGRNLRIQHLRFTYGSFPFYVAAGIAAILRLPARFHVTGEGGRRRVSLAPLVTLLAMGANIAAIPGALLLRPFDARTVTTMSWALMNVMLLSGIGILTLRAIARRGAEVRGAHKARTSVTAGESDILAGVPALPDRLGRPDLVSEARPHGVGLTLAFLTAAGLTLRLALAGTQSLRLDESLSLKQAGLRLPDLWEYLVTSNVHVPLYHSILHLWAGVAGASELALRIPSVVFGTIAIPLIYLVARRLAGPRTAIVAAALGAGSPFWVWHSDEARMYPLTLMMALASTLLFLRTIERPGAWRWVSYGLVLGVTLYSHYFTLMLPLVHLSYLAIHRVPRRAALRWFGGSFIAAVMFAPWAVTLYLGRVAPEGLTSISSGVRLTPPEYTFFGLLYGMVAFFAVFIIGYHSVAAITFVAGLLGGMWPLVIMRGGTIGSSDARRRRDGWFLIGWVLITVGCAFVLNIFMPGLLVQKYLIIASPPLFILLARGAQRFLAASRSRVAVTFAVLAAVAIVQNAEPENPLREDFRAASRIVRDTGAPGEMVFVLPRYNGTPFTYYHGDENVKGLIAPDAPPPAAVSELEGFAERHRGSTFWTVSMYADTIDPSDVVSRYLDASFDRLERYTIGAKMKVTRYRVPAVT